jgi:hypothetical protein
VIPEALTTNVTMAASRRSPSAIAAASAPASAPNSARPATASISSGGATATSAAARPAISPSTRYVAPPATDATHRRPGSGCASGPATSAAVMAARLIAWAPNGAPATVAAPVLTSAGVIGAR